MSRVLVVGLGNPGPEYEMTRHNVGFMVLDQFVSEHGLVPSNTKKKPHGAVFAGTVSGQAVTLLKPLTYMNRSGEAVAPVFNFYKISFDRLLVIHDDLDLGVGRMKFVRGGGAGGHKGVRSIMRHLGDQDFPRLKIGIGRPEGAMPVDRYVLSPFSKDETGIVRKVLKYAVDGIDRFLEQGIDAAMNEFNGIDLSEPGDSSS